jgi:hypothetical protein
MWQLFSPRPIISQNIGSHLLVHFGISNFRTVIRILSLQPESQTYSPQGAIVYGGGVLAHRTICTYYGKYILNIFQNVKKNYTKHSQCTSEQFMFTHNVLR